MKKVVFYFPWKELSGGPYYLSRLADDLANKDGYKVYYVDYKNGLTNSIIKNDKVIKIEYDDDYFNFPFDDATIIVTPIYWGYKIPKLHNNTKIVFFNWHYCCTPVLKHDSGWSNRIVNKFLKLVDKTNSCFFLDYSHWLGQNTNNIKFKENYVPIKLIDKNYKSDNKIINKKEINIGILGRLDGDKVYSALNVLDNLSHLDSINKKINVHVIGDGVHRSFFEETCRESNYRSKNINIIMYGTIENDKLNQLMSENIDILFAMGTSILEGASISLPSVIIPSGTVRFYDNKYVYLQDSVKGCVGWFYSQVDELGVKTIEIEKIIDDIYKKNMKEELGKKAYDYYCKNHKENIDKFIFALNDSTLEYEDIIKFYKRIDIDKKMYSFIKKNSKKIKNVFKKPSSINRDSCDLSEQTSSLLNALSDQTSYLLNALSYQNSLYSKVLSTHKDVFEKYKDLHKGESAVLIFTGETVKKFNHNILKDKIIKYISVDTSFTDYNINFDYYFALEYNIVKDSFTNLSKFNNLKMAKKFYGMISPINNSELIIPEDICSRDKAQRFYAHSVYYDNGYMMPRAEYAVDLCSDPLLCIGTIPVVAIQFLLYAGFDKIYLVGCDYTKDSILNYERRYLNKDLESIIYNWKKFSFFAQTYYPNTEIISINPIGLKGIFKELQL